MRSNRRHRQDIFVRPPKPFKGQKPGQKCASLDRFKQDEWNLTRLGKYFYNSKVKTLHAQSHDGNLMIAGKILIWLNGQRQLMPKVF